MGITKEQTEKCTDALGEDLYKELIEAKELTIKEIRFCAEYLTNGFNATRAYLVVYYDNDETKYAAANANCHRLIVRDSIKDVIAKLNNEWLGGQKAILENKIINRLTKKAFYDPSIFIKKNGLPAFENFEDIPEDLRHCIAGIKTNISGGIGKRSVKQEIKLVDQYKALDMLAKYLELFHPDINVNNYVSIPEDKASKLAEIFGERTKEKQEKKKGDNK
jgi:hypothetical protein